MVPSPFVQAPGVGSVSADQFNTYQQTVLNYAQLRTFTGLTYMSVYVLGAASPRDGGQGVYSYDASSTATDNNGSVIVPFGNVQGAWLADPAVLPPSGINVRYVTTGVTDSALTSDTLIVWQSASAAPKTETLPAPTIKGETFIVKDGLGNSATYPITVTAASGAFLGETVIDSPFMALQFVADGVSAWNVTTLYASNTNPAFDVLAYGAIGDGSTDDTAAINAAVAAATVAGGQVRFPAGVFKITSTVAGNIANNVNLTIAGAGQEATQILCVATNGFAFAFGNPYSSFSASGLTFVTDQVGGMTGLLLTLASGVAADSSGEFGPFNTIENVSFRGSDLYAAHTQYWMNAFVSTGVSNINIIGGGVNGPASPATSGVGYNISGNSATPFYAVAINFYGVGMNTLQTGVFYGDWTQGVTLDACNMTGCFVGVDTVTSPAGVLSQLCLVNCQSNTTACGVRVQTNTFSNIQISNNLFSINASSTAIQVMGSNFSITDNVIGGTTQTGTVAILVANTSGNGGVVSDNILQFLSAGIHVAAAVTGVLAMKWNQFTNITGSGANDYQITGGAAGVIISDDVPRNFASLPPCNAGTKYSRLVIADSPTVTFNGALTVGGSNNIGYALCNGSGYVFR